MDNFTVILLTIVIAILVLCITYLAGRIAKLRMNKDSKSPNPEPPRNPEDGQTFDLSIQFGGGESNRWQILDKAGDKKPLYVRRGDRIVWNISGTDAAFQFPLGDLLYFEADKSKNVKRVDAWTLEIGEGGGTLSVLVSAKAPLGAYTYSVFCNVQKSAAPKPGYAEGGSPPEFIIRI